MRELNEKEMEMVAGGDGIHLGGNGYISNTRAVTGKLGALGAATLAFDVGYAIGTGLNMLTDSMYGTSTSEQIGGAVYENS
jgi:hypothetical protein